MTHPAQPASPTPAPTHGAATTSELHPADVRAFATSATFFGFDRKQTRTFLERVANRLEELEHEAQGFRDRESAISETLIAATTVARSIEHDARSRSKSLEQEAKARVAAVEQEHRQTHRRIVDGLERANVELSSLIAALRPTTVAVPEPARPQAVPSLGERSTRFDSA
jgi:cell division septum initiation protein DivIVA